ncbi:E3 SUMO-protein ligase ZBED1-like [Xyrichtys novacula]|uniref:E3 SUMO-protein ligase ZBED1-like n=1 Tax=Xyrichtys novacula TaxID=13765 RepID=A0AAV1HHL7_XYRNO|nr:E3 SUMO-protein ligase ZBED1-like [Xyrichtys novacula]
MSDEKNPTVSVIAPLHALLLQAIQGTLGDSLFVRELKEAIHQDLSNSYTSEVEKATLNLASALDPRFKVLPFLPEEDKQETLSRMVVKAGITEETKMSRDPHLQKEECPVRYMNYLETLLGKPAGRQWHQHFQRSQPVTVQQRR